MLGTLTPAYGRDYKSGKALKEDWDANKDFVINNPYGDQICNKTDLTKEHGKGVKLQARFKANRNVCMVTT